MAQLLEDSRLSGVNLDSERRNDAEAPRPSATEAKRSLLDLFESLSGLDVETQQRTPEETAAKLLEVSNKARENARPTPSTRP